MRAVITCHSGDSLYGMAESSTFLFITCLHLPKLVRMKSQILPRRSGVHRVLREAEWFSFTLTCFFLKTSSWVTWGEGGKLKTDGSREQLEI